MTQARREFTVFLRATCCLSMLVMVSATAIAGGRPQADRPAARAKPGADQHEIRLETRLPSGELSRRAASSSAADQIPDPRSSASGENCGACSAGTDGQLGFGDLLNQPCNQEGCWDWNGNGVCDVDDEDRTGDGICDRQDCVWGSLAFPIHVAEFDTLRFTVNTNRAGGDIYIMRNVPGDCQPDTTQILHTFCCVLEGLEESVEHEIHFPLTVGEFDAPTWVIFEARTDAAGQDEEGTFNGGNFPGHQVARDTTTPSSPGQAFVNLAGRPGEWWDLGAVGPLGTCYAVNLDLTGQDPDPPTDCANVPTGACCELPDWLNEPCMQTLGFLCGAYGGIYLGDNTSCDDCPVCGNGIDELREQCDGEDGTEGCLDGLCRDDCVCLCDIPLEGAAENDCCLEAIPISVGDTEYDTTNAQTDGLPSPGGLCNDFGSPQTGNDIWYNFTAECNGNLLVSTCGGAGVCDTDTTECEGGAFDGLGCASDGDCVGGGPGGFAQYDSDLVLYEGCDECPPSPDSVIACNDDFSQNPDSPPCGTVLFASAFEAEVQGGTCYKLRAGGFGVGQSGPGVLHLELTCVTQEALIIKQGACPAPVNPHSHGVIPMVLVGSETLDVSTIDLDSLRLRRCDGEGVDVAPLAGHTRVVDLNHPPDGEVGCGGCACNANQSSDGIDDLALKFRTDEMLAALGIGPGNGVVAVELSGNTTASDVFLAHDCLMAVPPGAGEATLTLGANAADTFVEVSPLDINFDNDGFTNFSRGYIAGTNVMLTAPAISDGRKFLRWSVDGVLQPVGGRALEMIMTADTNLKAIYAHGARPDADRPRSDDGSLD